MRLYFYPQGFPRDITRDEWKRIWRWKRVTIKELEVLEQQQIALLRDPKLHERIKIDIMDKLAFPPIVIHESQELTPCLR